MEVGLVTAEAGGDTAAAVQVTGITAAASVGAATEVTEGTEVQVEIS